MKAFLVLAVIFAGVWLWRNRQAVAEEAVVEVTFMDDMAAPPPPPKTMDMVRCAHCGLHIAGVEALPGKHGQYCCQEHLQRAES